MTIRSIDLPETVLAALEPFQDLIFGNQETVKAAAPSWDKYPRHEFFNCTLNDCAEGNAISKAYHTGWSIVVDHEDNGAVSVEIGINRDGKPAFDGINTGYAAATKAVLRRAAENTPEQQDLLVRMLRLPQIYIRALWLRDEKDNQNDIIFPLAQAPAELPTDQKMTVDGFENAIAILAKRRLSAE